MLSQKFARKALLDQEPEQRVVTLANMLVEEMIEQRRTVGHQYMPINIEITVYGHASQEIRIKTVLSDEFIEGKSFPGLAEYAKEWDRIKTPEEEL